MEGRPGRRGRTASSHPTPTLPARPPPGPGRRGPEGGSVALARHRAGFVVGLVLAAVLATLVVAPLSGLIVGMAAGPGKVRTYYIAGDEVEWDYAPLGYNAITGEPFGEEENVFVANGPYTIGSVYVKALYREYTDATFTSLKPRPPEWGNLGALGPLLFAEVGDTIVVE